MRKAEEWATDDKYGLKDEAITLEPFIRAIQADARESALLDAAHICMRYHRKGVEMNDDAKDLLGRYTSEAVYRTADKCRIGILELIRKG